MGDKLVWVSSLVIILSLVSIAIVFTVLSNNQARESLGNDLNVLANLVGGRSVAALVFRDQRTAKQNMESIQFNQNVSKACLYLSSGKLFATYLSNKQVAKCPEIIGKQRTSHEDPAYIFITSEIKEAGDLVGHISIYGNTDQIEENLKKALLTTLIAFVLILVIALWQLNKVIRKTLIPLTNLHNTALTISNNPFSSLRAKRLKDDEVGRLVNVFNVMLDTIASENKALTSSEIRFRSLAENSPVGIYQMNREFKFVYTNQRWTELTGITKQINCKDYHRFIPNNGSDKYLALLETVKTTRKAQVIEYQFSRLKHDETAVFLEHIAPVLESSENGEIVTGYIGSLQDISELKSAQLELENLAFYDPLTSLPNRRFFMDHIKYVLSKTKPEKNPLAILLLDLDDFKKVNDTLGHDAGDQLLVILSDRLRSVVSKHDIVSRMGGDEFLVLLKQGDLNSSIQRVADRMLESIRQPVSILGQDIEVTASIGVATYPGDALTPQELIRNADLALYLSKDNGRNRLSFFSKKLELIINEKVRMERKLRQAIKLNAFTFHVQPQWCFATKRLRSCEVLIRWFDDAEGSIGPNEFIPIAEETGLINKIGDWLIEEVIKSIAENKAELIAKGINYLAINLSAKQFFNTNLALNISQVLKANGVEPSMIELEITESCVMEDTELAIKIMSSLKAIGCRISIDDFGTGYSSLSYLKKFPIDAVKIDQSFISDIPHDQNDIDISIAVIVMSHSLGLEVVAEGVETNEQVDFLMDNTCDYAQGYFVAKPLPFETMLTQIDEINTMMLKCS